MTLEEASVDAAWVRAAGRINKGKNMGSYTSSGSAASSLQALLDKSKKPPSVPSALKTCASAECGKVEASAGAFMQCSRCKQAHYCSKECQVMSWKHHKKTCKAGGA